MVQCDDSVSDNAILDRDGSNDSRPNNIAQKNSQKGDLVEIAESPLQRKTFNVKSQE